MLNILIVGVGGQGSLLASRILGGLFMGAGLDVKLSEVHGMSQRGGSVVTYIRAGEDVASPLVPKGEADVIISFELVEAVRYLPWLKKGGTVVVNTQKITPLPVLTGAAVYPGDALGLLRRDGVNLIAFDAQGAAQEAGSNLASNVALLGAASAVIGFDRNVWEDVISSTVKAEFVELNLKAFDKGFSFSKN